MSIIDVGIDWFNSQRKIALEKVTISTASITRGAKASVIEPETAIGTDGIRVKTDRYVFLIDNIYLTDLDLKRGVRIVRDDKEPAVIYEVILDRQMLEDFNDPNNTVKAISTKRKA